MKLPSILGIRSARDKPQDSYAGSVLSFLFGRTTSGKSVNERTAMQTTAVYSCVSEHPLYTILHDEPNVVMTSFVLRETMMSHPLVYGDAWSQIIRDGRIFAHCHGKECSGHDAGL